MDGSFQAGWYEHPTLGVIKIYQQGSEWVYRCYTKNAKKPLSREKTLDTWTWALSTIKIFDED